MTVYCCRCSREAEAPIPVGHVERASGPSVTVYACPDCAPQVAPGPLWDELPLR
ncbi:hypothetical protein ACF1BP_07625 [Streptomyces sp. NPDC014735]|uniref:hypothetical protein n=1 Tax=unclassified Streptomyces TaxID=2593676 RepID=UPI003702B2E9